MYTVELTNSQHIDDLIGLSYLMQAELSPRLPFDEDAIRYRARHLIKYPESRVNLNCLICYTHGHVPVGFLVCHSSQFLFNDKRLCSQELIFIKEEHRKSHAFWQLMKAYDKWSDMPDCLQSHCGEVYLDGRQIDGLENVFNRLGYRKAGTYYIKEYDR